MWGVAPTRRDTFVSAKVSKTISASVRPQGGSSASAPNKMARELAPLKQPSPKSRFGTAAPPHPKAVRHSKNKTSFQTGVWEMQLLPKLNTIPGPQTLKYFLLSQTLNKRLASKLFFVLHQAVVMHLPFSFLSLNSVPNWGRT